MRPLDRLLMLVSAVAALVPGCTQKTVDHRPIEHLIDLDEPGMDLVREWLSDASNPVVVLDGSRHAGERSLLALQISSRSPMGGLALETGGLLVDGGWVRVLGSGNARLPRAIDAWNALDDDGGHRSRGMMLVGDDAVAGFFAVNGGAIDGPLGHVYYFAPDTLAWSDIAESYSAWLHWLFHGDLEDFYQGLRWPGWREEIESLGGDRAYSVYPFLWAEGPAIGERSRRDIPIDELWGLNTVEFPKQLGR